MKRKWIIVLIILVFLTTAIGCTVMFLRKDDRPKVIIVLKELNSQYWKLVKAGAEKGFRDFNIDGKVIATRDGLVEEQNDILEKALKEKPDVLIVSPLSSSMPILKEFEENKIPVLLVDTDIPLEHKTAYIGTDNFELGRKAGELLASELQPGDKVVIPFSAEDLVLPIFSERIKGATFSLENAGIKVVTETINLSNESLSVKKAMTTILQKYPEVKGVFALNDTRALSALEVIKAHGLKIPVIGADGIIKMVELIEDGTLTGTVAQNPYDIGYMGIETASRVIEGRKIAKNIDTGIDVITKDNAKMKLDFLKQLLR